MTTDSVIAIRSMAANRSGGVFGTLGGWTMCGRLFKTSSSSRRFFFPGQVGQGKLTMDRLAANDVDLWDNVGLGGSQKCELATVDMMGWTYDQVDVATFLQKQFQRGCKVEAWFEAGAESRWRRGTVMEQEVKEVTREDGKARDHVARWTVHCDETGEKFVTERVCDTSMTMRDLLRHFGQGLRRPLISWLVACQPDQACGMRTVSSPCLHK